MNGNSFGKALILTTFGESHGQATGGVLDGFPAGIPVDPVFIQSELDRRRPHDTAFSTTRKEKDRVELLSGIFESKSTGAPIAFIVYNEDARSEDYLELKDLYRPSHADYTWSMKYGHRDHRGGGRASGRETLARVAGGALAKLFLNTCNISVVAQISQIGSLPIKPAVSDPQQLPAEVMAYLEQLKNEGDTTGGIIHGSITGVPPGLGEPVFDKLEADLGKAMLSIPAAKAFEIGSGFSGVSMKGSQHNDPFILREGTIHTTTNFSGGIQGGISNGEEIFFRVGFKPVPTLQQEQETLTTSGEKIRFKPSGRHDVCLVPRALPVVEGMAALVIADHLLRARSNRS